MLADRPKGKVVAAVQSVPWDVGTSSRMGKQGALPSSIMAVQRFHGHLFGKQGWDSSWGAERGSFLGHKRLLLRRLPCSVLLLSRQLSQQRLQVHLFHLRGHSRHAG